MMSAEPEPDASSAPGSFKSTPRIVFLIPFLTDVSAMLMIFTVGRFLAESGASLLKLGIVGGGHALVAATSSLAAGVLSDRWGRERVILPGMGVFLVAALGCAVLPLGHSASVVLYWGSAAALGMIHPPTIAWINTGEAASRSVRSKGVSGNLVRFCIAWNTGVLLAQFGGGQLFVISPRLPFAVAAAVMAVDGIVATVVAKRMRWGRKASTERREHREKAFDQSDGRGDAGPQAETATVVEPDALSDTFVRLAWMANLGGAIAVGILLHLFPRLAVELGIPADSHGALLASMRVIAIAVYVVLHGSQFWQYRFSVSATVQGIAVTGLLCIAAAVSVPMLLAGVWGMSLLLGFNYFSGIYYGSAGHEEDRRGFASGMHQATLGLGIAIGSVGGGVLGTVFGGRTPYVVAAAILVALIAVQAVAFARFRGGIGAASAGSKGNAA